MSGTASTRTGTSPISREEIVCPFDYTHQETCNDGGGITFVAGSDERDNSEPYLQKSAYHQHPHRPIEIVRQAGSFVEFKVRDNDAPFFAPSSVANQKPLRTFAMYEKDALGQKYCRTFDSSSFVSSTEAIQAHCSTMGKFAQVSVYAVFDNDGGDGDDEVTDGRNENQNSLLRIPPRCQFDDDNDDASSSASFFTSSNKTVLIEHHVFNLMCLPTTCLDNDGVERLREDMEEPSLPLVPSGKAKSKSKSKSTRAFGAWKSATLIAKPIAEAIPGGDIAIAGGGGGDGAAVVVEATARVVSKVLDARAVPSPILSVQAESTDSVEYVGGEALHMVPTFLASTRREGRQVMNAMADGAIENGIVDVTSESSSGSTVNRGNRRQRRPWSSEGFNEIATLIGVLGVLVLVYFHLNGGK